MNVAHRDSLAFDDEVLRLFLAMLVDFLPVIFLDITGGLVVDGLEPGGFLFTVQVKTFQFIADIVEPAQHGLLLPEAVPAARSR